MNTLTTTHLRTYMGKNLDVFNPDPSQIDIMDIAHALSNQCRWGGHTRIFYSVAQHSIAVANRLVPALRVQGLLHDAAEAYLVDLPRPIKKNISEYSQIEDNLMKVIAAKFEFDYPFHPEVLKADDAELQREYEIFMLREEGLFVGQYNCDLRPSQVESNFLLSLRKFQQEKHFPRKFPTPK